MNKLLQLKGTFEQASSNFRPGPPNLPAGKSLEVSKLEKLKKDLVELKKVWSQENILPGVLISVYYNKVAAKSNRIKGLLAKGNKNTANSSIVGARFNEDSSPKHIITHYVSKEILDESIVRLDLSIQVLKEKFGGSISHANITKINSNDENFPSSKIAKTNFVKVIVDAFYVEKFGILVDDVELANGAIITIYKTDVKTIELMEKLGIKLSFNRVMDETTILLRPDELAILKQKAPYLISMAVSDITQLTKADFDLCVDKAISIPSPKNEPIIGVIDTLFDERVYFSEWVEFKNMVAKDISTSPSDYDHGTAVSSIIVDGPSFNPDLEDGCGRFRVRHFGVAAGGQFSSFTILRNINETE